MTPQLKKFAKLLNSETDALALLIMEAKRIDTVAEFLVPKHYQALNNCIVGQIKDMCSAFIIRHRGDPKVHAISPDLAWVIEIPAQDIAEALRNAARAQQARESGAATAPEPEPPPSAEPTPENPPA